MLLYGYPGCGKTYIANALSSFILSETMSPFRSVSFYHVKGPELLDKYIGSSEAAVRRLFERAKESAPSIIFFDEFDALVPQRYTHHVPTPSLLSHTRHLVVPEATRVSLTVL